VSVQPAGKIIAYVHWGDQPIAGRRIQLVETGQSLYTDSAGRVEFITGPGTFVVRAYGINRGGPAYISVDFEAVVLGGDTAFVDIVDCLPCL